MWYLMEGNVGGFTPDGTLPEGAVQCTKEQAEYPQIWKIVDGKIVPRVQTPEEIAADMKAAAVSQLASFQSLANLQIQILTDATDPDIVDSPTAEDIALLLAWKKYRQALRAVVTTANPVLWPTQPQKASGTSLITNES